MLVLTALPSPAWAGGPLVAVSGAPFTTPQCDSPGNDGEVSVAVDPVSGKRVAAWMQQIAGLGDAGGQPLDSTDVLTASSTDGVTWTAPNEPGGVMLCEAPPGVNDVSGDPTVSVGPDGRWYLSVLATDGFPGAPATDGRVYVRTSTDGTTWSPAAVQVPDPGDDDFPSVVADPSTPGRAWVVTSSYPLPVTNAIDQSPPQQSQIVISTTTDGGATFSVPTAIHSTDGGMLDVASRLVAFADGTLLDVFMEAPSYIGLTGSGPLVLYATRSGDHGATWSTPTAIGSGSFDNVVDPVTGATYAKHCCVLSVGAGPTGTAAVAWTSQAPNGTGEVHVASSSDGGASWSTVSLPRGKPAFTPSVAVNGDRLAVTWYDFTGQQPPGMTAPTTLWAATSSGNGGVWDIRALAGPFDLSTGALFGANNLGDYQSVVPVGSGFEATFTVGRPIAQHGPTDIFTATL